MTPGERYQLEIETLLRFRRETLDERRRQAARELDLICRAGWGLIAALMLVAWLVATLTG